MLQVLRWPTTDGSTVINDPGSLRVVGTLSPLHETLLGYQQPLSAILVPLSPVLGPSRFYVAASQLVSSNPAAPIDSRTTTTTTTSDPLPRAPPGPPRRLFSQSPAASEANFPSSAARSRDSISDEDKEESAVEQIAAYSKPVSIPSSGRAHFSTMNVADGSYHFGYDTGN